METDREVTSRLPRRALPCWGLRTSTPPTTAAVCDIRVLPHCAAGNSAWPRTHTLAGASAQFSAALDPVSSPSCRTGCSDPRDCTTPLLMEYKGFGRRVAEPTCAWEFIAALKRQGKPVE